LFDQ